MKNVIVAFLLIVALCAALYGLLHAVKLWDAKRDAARTRFAEMCLADKNVLIIEQGGKMSCRIDGAK